ncbi:ABC transporter permease [Natronoglycomyces albus]|uniref:ABC transporter permease n=1 Tax=Natronoglycomyces albus TaxID=2811108 RepID=A0A895XSS5_9ACTN|nr:ABC transporter permease [Natronoglycomyces albus]QSB06712.1 ABC transporter permease [Natronoglycomyces albus]
MKVMSVLTNNAPRAGSRRVLPAAWVLGGAEMRLIVRNRTVLLTSMAMPIGFAFLWLMTGRDMAVGGGGDIAAMQMGFLLLFGVFLGLTMTLAARRQSLYLKRLRTSPASAAAIVSGLTIPFVALVTAQTVLALVLTAVTTESSPQRIDIVLFAFVVGVVSCAALGFLTATFTSTPEAAQITTLPGFLVLMGGIIFSLMTQPQDIAVWHLAIPGVAIGHLSRMGWNGLEGESLSVLWLGLLVSVVLTAAICAVAARYFRWQPRL